MCLAKETMCPQITSITYPKEQSCNQKHQDAWEFQIGWVVKRKGEVSPCDCCFFQEKTASVNTLSTLWWEWADTSFSPICWYVYIDHCKNADTADSGKLHAVVFFNRRYWYDDTSKKCRYFRYRYQYRWIGFKVWVNTYSWGARKLGSEYSSWFRRLVY